MKKIFLFIALGLLSISCEIGGDTTASTLEILTVSEVDMPTAFRRDSITEITVKYIRPTSCYFFNSFYYAGEDFDRTVAVYCAKTNQEGCQNDNVTVVEVPLRFRPSNIGTYHFKFWTGEDAAGVDQFLEYDAIVDH